MGDLIQACAVLRPDAEGTREIAALLQVAPMSSEAPQPEGPEMPRAPRERPALEPSTSNRLPPQSQPGAFPVAENASGSRMATSPTVPSKLEQLPSARQPPPAWVSSASPLPPHVPTASALRPAAIRQPLFLPRWTRSILSGALSRRRYDGPVNVGLVVETIAKGESVGRLPRYPRPTMAGGIQVLLDKSEAMLPYAADQKWLTEEIRRVGGRENVQVLSFANCPSRRAGTKSRRRWRAYPREDMPARDTVVIVLTDLGIGSPPSLTEVPGSVEEWAVLAVQLRRRRCPLTAFVPYRRARWPGTLQRLITIFQWDRCTDAPAVFARVGKGLRIRGVPLSP